MKKLPKFSIVAIADRDCSGQFEPSKLIGEDWIGCLLLASERLVCGRFLSVNVAARTALFRAASRDGVASLEAGKTFPYLDGYWGERAELVLDRTRDWRKARFTAQDAVEYIRDGQRMITRVGPGVPAGGRVVAEMWDHEHCAMCCSEIGQQRIADAWINAQAEWLCTTCYETYVVPRSLEFVNTE